MNPYPPVIEIHGDDITIEAHAVSARRWSTETVYLAAQLCLMALSPFLLLLDEAFEGLAPAVVGRFRDAVIMIKQMGISILIAESNLVNAAAVADRLYAIDRGEIIFHGSPQDALGNEAIVRTLRG